MDPTLKFLDDGRVICQICCEAKTHEELAPVEDEPGRVWDVCIECTQRDAMMTHDQWCHVSTPHEKHGVCLGWPSAKWF